MEVAMWCIIAAIWIAGIGTAILINLAFKLAIIVVVGETQSEGKKQ